MIFLSANLVSLGYNVIVYAEPLAEERGLDDTTGVIWRDIDDYDMESPPDIFVAWRYHISLALAINSEFARPKKVFLWLQDVPGFTSYTDKLCSSVDGIFVLSTFHKKLLPFGDCRNAGVVTPNGIDVR